jgi:hypothetical protein
VPPFDAVGLDAFDRLLSRPDPPDLPRRAHVWRYEGEPNRRQTRFQPILMGWLQRRYLERDLVEEPVTREMKTRNRRVGSEHPALRLLRRTGTA